MCSTEEASIFYTHFPNRRMTLNGLFIRRVEKEHVSLIENGFSKKAMNAHDT